MEEKTELLTGVQHMLTVLRRWFSTPSLSMIMRVSAIAMVFAFAQAQNDSNQESKAVTAANAAQKLMGLWEAKRRFGPEIRGTLIIKKDRNEWWAWIAGKTVQAKLDGDAITFELTGGANRFQGKLDARRTKIVGHWIQPATLEAGSRYASPVTLTNHSRDEWRGIVAPLDSMMTLYLTVKTRDDGSVGAFLKNPERNIGWTRQYRVDQIDLAGESVKLLAVGTGAKKGSVLAEGRYDADNEVLSIYFPNRGGTFDFRRVTPEDVSDFYPRGRPTGTYVYAAPLPLEDGWTTASLEDVGISREGIEKYIQTIINIPIDSIHAPEIHGVLIARNGKLVLEEYFHGENGEKPHDTRSAAKSLTATFVGAGIHAGVPLKLSTPVYRVMNGGEFPPDLDPRKKALTVEHLLTMSSGLDCDDNDDNSPGREDYMVDESGEPDYYKFMMALKMIRQPGEAAVYCSGVANLLGGVLKHASGKPLPVLFHELIAEPLQINRYYLNLTPTGDAYMGGGVRLLLRDFMKLGQLHLNGGVWNGHRILSEEWCRRAISPLYQVKDYKPREPYKTLRYGYLWWVLEYPYNGRTLQAFYAGGNGGQVVMGIPELDLVIATYGGSYNDSVMFDIQTRHVPEHILPAVAPR